MQTALVNPHLPGIQPLVPFSNKSLAVALCMFATIAVCAYCKRDQSLPLYGLKLLSEYYTEGAMRGQGIETTTRLPPHVFAIADSAYRDMMQVCNTGLCTSKFD